MGNSSTYCTRLPERSTEPNTRSITDSHDLLVESVGYTEGDHSPANLYVMKASALAWCLGCNHFMQVWSGSDIVREDNLGLLAWLFPHLDLFSLGGFYDPNVRNALRALAAAFMDLIDTISPLHLFTFSLLCLVYLAFHFLFVLNLLCSLLR